MRLKLPGQDDHRVGIVHFRLGSALVDFQRFDAAIAHLREALRIVLTEKEAGLQDVLASRRTLGSALLESGSLDEAEQQFRAVLNTFDSSKNYDPSALSTALNNLSQVFLSKGDYDVAREFLEKAIRLEPNDPTLLSNMGPTLTHIGDTENALAYHRRAVEAERRESKEPRPKLACALNNLGMALYRAEDFDGAQKSFVEAIRIMQAAGLDQAHDTASYRMNLGGLMLSQGDYANAREQFERVLTIYEQVLEPNHPDLAFIYTNPGTSLRMTGEFAAARQYIEKSVRIRE